MFRLFVAALAVSTILSAHASPIPTTNSGDLPKKVLDDDVGEDVSFLAELTNELALEKEMFETIFKTTNDTVAKGVTVTDLSAVDHIDDSFIKAFGSLAHHVHTFGLMSLFDFNWTEFAEKRDRFVDSLDHFGKEL